MESNIPKSAPAREEKRAPAASGLSQQAPSVIRVGVARVPSHSLTLVRRRAGT